MAASCVSVSPLRFLSLWKKSELLSSQALYCLSSARCNSNSASITRPRRNCYTKSYPTLLVFPDGSSINIRYKEPRQIIKLPLDFSKLSEAEKKKVLSNRKPKEKIEIVEDFDDSFDASQYAKYWKK